MSTSSIGTELDSIRSGLIARAALGLVNVYTGPVSIEEAGLECIAIADCSLDEEEASIGGLGSTYREESWDIEGEIRIVKAWEVDTETTIKSARDRALELLAEVETYLNDTYVGTYPNVELIAGELIQTVGPEGRVCSILFTLQMTTLKNP